METESPTRIERVHISWTEDWGLDHYVEQYLRTRRLAPTDEKRATVRRCIAGYPGSAPVTKASLDYFLDSNIGR